MMVNQQTTRERNIFASLIRDCGRCAGNNAAGHCCYHDDLIGNNNGF